MHVRDFYIDTCPLIFSHMRGMLHHDVSVYQCLHTLIHVTLLIHVRDVNVTHPLFTSVKGLMRVILTGPNHFIPLLSNNPVVQLDFFV